MNKVCVIIPIHPPKKAYLNELLKTYTKNKNYIDIFIIFTNINEKNVFNDILTDDIKTIILSTDINLNILNKNFSFINFKKIYALNEINNKYNYDYSIVIDSDSLFLDLKNIYSICQRFCEKKQVYGTPSNPNTLSGVDLACASFISQFEKNINYSNDIYFWFSQIPIYDMKIVDNFLKFINFKDTNQIINKITYGTFDYIIYIYYCVIKYNYKIINLENYNIYTKNIPNWSLEMNMDKEIFDNLNNNNIEINWQFNNFKYVINDNICMLYHTDRRASISKSEQTPPL